MTNVRTVGCVLGSLFGAAFALVACGSDDDSPPASDVNDAPVGTSDSGNTNPNPPDSGSPPGTTCGTVPDKKGFVGSQKIQVSGDEHSYELFLPNDYDGMKSYPVIFVFHGDGGTGAGIRGYFPIEDASGGAAIIVYPDGPSETWQIDGYDDMMKDIGFIDAVADSLAKTYCVDTSRMFATGFSKGAYFVNQLACRSKTVWKAIVSNSGGGPFGTDDRDWGSDGNLKCPHAPTAALQVQGTDDNTVGPEEGMKARDFWKGANGCKDSTSSYDPSPCVAYDGCAKPEVWCSVDGLGHSVWSETPKVAWAFFSK